MSLIHPGASINFDGTDLQRREEEEIQREDIKQQQELHDLLSAELPEELLNDSCNGSIGSQPRLETEQQSYCNSQVSSSNTGSWRSGSHDEVVNLHHNVTSSGDAPSFFANQIPAVRHHFTNGYGKEFIMNEYNQQYTDAEKWQMHQQQLQQTRIHQPVPTHDIHAEKRMYYRQDNFGYMNPDIYGFSERREAEGSEDFDAVSHDINYRRENKDFRSYPAYSSPSSQPSTTPGKSVRFETKSAPTSPYANPYTVQYNPAVRYGCHNTDEISDSSKANSKSKTNESIGSDYVDASDVNLTTEVVDNRELTQLRILYDARGKKIEKLNREIEGLKQDSDREKRILSHQLAMAEDQKVGMNGSLEECQRLLVDKDRKINEEEAKTNTLHVEVEALKKAKIELVKKIEVGERTIENLQQEVTLLQRSDTLERTRQQHDDVIANLNEQHERQLLEVTSQLDEVRRIADEKTEETEQLRIRLKAALKESEEVLLEKSETINRLSRNLEDSQNHCQSLLAGSGENAFLQRQVGDLMNDKNLLDKKNKNLEDLVCELEKTVTLYENAFQLGAINPLLNPDGLAESYNELGIKRKIDWKSPKLSSNDKVSSENLVDSLRLELERALSNNKEKRDKIADLQKQVEDLTEESRHWRERIEEMKRERNDSGRLSNSHRDDLEQELEDSLQRMNSAEERAMRLEETCRDLKKQMCELVEQHDANKQEAVDRCERACMLLHEDAKQAIREELIAEHEQKLYELSIEHDGELQKLRDAMEAMNSELSEVKQSYVHICADKDQIEEKLKQEAESEKQELLTKIENDKEKVESELRESLEEKKKEYERELEEKLEEQLSTKIALAKVSWMEEHANNREDALRDLTKKKDEEFARRLEGLRSELKIETEKEISRVLEHERVEWETEKEKEIESRINELYEELNEEKKTAVTAATSIAQLNWITEQRNSTEAEFEKRLGEAKKSWQDEHEKFVNSKVEEIKNKFQNKIEVLNEERDALVNQEVRRAEKEWKRKRDESLRRKDMEMQEQLKKIRDKHQKDYEAFTNHHKKSLENFLQDERSRSNIRDKQNDPNDELQKQWLIERDRLLQDHQNSLKKLETLHDTRCQDYRLEIQRLSSAYEVAVQRLSLQADQDESNKIAELQQKNKDDMERLKSRMKDEYRRWKRERDDLRKKLEKATKPVQSQQTNENIDPKLFVELREIYISTLGTIKSEMIDFVRESKVRSVTAIKRESSREKERIVDKIRSRSRQREEEAVLLPSFLNNRDKEFHRNERSSAYHQKIDATSSEKLKSKILSPSTNHHQIRHKSK